MCTHVVAKTGNDQDSELIIKCLISKFTKQFVLFIYLLSLNAQITLGTVLEKLSEISQSYLSLHQTCCVQQWVVFISTCRTAHQCLSSLNLFLGILQGLVSLTACCKLPQQCEIYWCSFEFIAAFTPCCKATESHHAPFTMLHSWDEALGLMWGPFSFQTYNQKAEDSS